MMAYTISIIILDGIRLNGSVVKIPLHLSFTVRIYRSISPTCSSFDVVFSAIPMALRSPRMFSNSPSISIKLIRNPLCLYTLHMFLILFSIVDPFLLLSISALENLMFRESVIINGIRFIYMMSAHSVTSLYRSRICIGISLYCGLT